MLTPKTFDHTDAPNGTYAAPDRDGKGCVRGHFYAFPKDRGGRHCHKPGDTPECLAALRHDETDAFFLKTPGTITCKT